MTTTFKELQISARFTADNYREIIRNRGDRYVSWSSYAHYPKFVKRDEFGGHIITHEVEDVESVYYRIEPDNVVETI